MTLRSGKLRCPQTISRTSCGIDFSEKFCSQFCQKNRHDGIVATMLSFLSCDRSFFFVFLLVLVLATPPGHMRRGNTPCFLHFGASISYSSSTCKAQKHSLFSPMKWENGGLVAVSIMGGPTLLLFSPHALKIQWWLWRLLHDIGWWNGGFVVVSVAGDPSLTFPNDSGHWHCHHGP